jgi:hypothetical protein
MSCERRVHWLLCLAMTNAVSIFGNYIGFRLTWCASSVASPFMATR